MKPGSTSLPITVLISDQFTPKFFSASSEPLREAKISTFDGNPTLLPCFVIIPHQHEQTNDQNKIEKNIVPLNAIGYKAEPEKYTQCCNPDKP